MTEPRLIRAGNQIRTGSLAAEFRRDLPTIREVGRRLFLHNVRAQYRRSVLGYAWLVATPLVTTLLWIFLDAANLVTVGETEVPYAVHVLVGTVLWQSFVDALNAPIRQLESSRDMLTKAPVPREALLIAGMGEVLFSVGVRVLLALAAILIAGVTPPGTFIFSPVGFVVLLTFATAIGVFLAPLSLLLPDIQRAVTTVIPIWFFLTPVVFPTPTEGRFAQVVRFNPVTPILSATRQWLTAGDVDGVRGFVVMLVVSPIMLLFALVFSRVSIPHVIERSVT